MSKGAVLAARKSHCGNRNSLDQSPASPRRAVNELSGVLLAWALIAVPLLSVAQDARPIRTIEQAMTPQQLKDTGVSTLAPSQRKALDAWLNFYTETVVKIASGRVQSSESSPPTSSTPPTVRSAQHVPSTYEEAQAWENYIGSYYTDEAKRQQHLQALDLQQREAAAKAATLSEKQAEEAEADRQKLRKAYEDYVAAPPDQKEAKRQELMALQSVMALMHPEPCRVSPSP